MNQPAAGDRKHFGFYIALAGITASAFALRYFRAGLFSIGNDEAFAAFFAGDPRLILKGVHPPLYYLGLAVWTAVFSDGPWSLRALSCLIGSSGVAAAGLLGRRLAGESVGIASALFLAVFPYHMFISQQQGLAVAASSMAILAAWLLVRGTLAEPCKKSAVALAVVNVAGVLTMYGFVFAVLAQGLLLVFLRRQDQLKRNDIRFALLAPFAALLLASPLVYAQFKILKQQMAAFPMLMRLWEAPLGVWVADLGFGAPWGIVFAEGSAAPQWIGITLSVLGFLLLVAGTFQAVREREAAGMGILGAAYGTLFVIGIASLAVPLWNDRTFAFIVPFFALILALAVTRFRKTLYPVAAIVVTFAAIGWAQDQIRASGENAAWHKPPAWDAVARELDASLRGGDTVLAVPGWHSEVLRYHLRHGTKEKEGSLIPIVGVPYDHFRAATEETADIGSPQGSAVWLVAAEGFFTQGVTKALAKEGFVLERHTSFWRVSLDLYVTKDMAKPKPAAATPDDAAETAETTDSLE